MIRLTFSSTDEYLAELAEEKPNVYRGIVRMTFRTSRSGDLPINSKRLLSNAIVVCEGQTILLQLDHYLGEYMYPSDGEFLKKAQEKGDELEKRLKELGFSVRAGTYQASS